MPGKNNEPIYRRAIEITKKFPFINKFYHEHIKKILKKWQKAFFSCLLPDRDSNSTNSVQVVAVFYKIAGNLL